MCRDTCIIVSCTVGLGGRRRSERAQGDCLYRCWDNGVGLGSWHIWWAFVGYRDVAKTARHTTLGRPNIY